MCIWTLVLFVTSLWQGATAGYPATWNKRYEATCPGDTTGITRASHFPVFEGSVLVAAGMSQVAVGLLFTLVSLYLVYATLCPWWMGGIISYEGSEHGKGNGTCMSLLSFVGLGRGSHFSQACVSVGEYLATRAPAQHTAGGGGGGEGGGNGMHWEAAEARSLRLCLSRADSLMVTGRTLIRFFAVTFCVGCVLLAPAFMQWLAAASLSPELASWFVLPSSYTPLANPGAANLCGPCDIEDPSARTGADVGSCSYSFTPGGLAALLASGGRVAMALHVAAAALTLSDVSAIGGAAARLVLQSHVRDISMSLHAEG